MKKYFCFYSLTRRCMVAGMICISYSGYSQSSDDFMRSTGKIYVVAAVTLVILLGIFVYLMYLEKKISRIEKRHNNE